MSKKKHQSNAGRTLYNRQYELQLAHLARGCSPACPDYAELDVRKTMYALEHPGVVQGINVPPELKDKNFETLEEYTFWKEFLLHASTSSVPLKMDLPMVLIERSMTCRYLLAWVGKKRSTPAFWCFMKNELAFKSSFEALVRSGVLTVVQVPQLNKVAILISPQDDPTNYGVLLEVIKLEAKLTVAKSMYKLAC